jgi:hypothetical protein
LRFSILSPKEKTQEYQSINGGKGHKSNIRIKYQVLKTTQKAKNPPTFSHKSKNT